MPNFLMFMENQKLFFLLSSLLFLTISAKNDCPAESNCNKSFTIKFPFRLENQPQKCGYPGFTLMCTINQDRPPIINLPFSGDFFVRYIDYLSQEILLFDPSNCLPRRLLDLNLSNSPFLATYYQNYTFLKCDPNQIMSKFNPIDCLSNSTSSIIATSSLRLAKAMNMCSIIETLPIPFSNNSPPNNVDGFSVDFNGDLLLAWYIPNCEDCEANGSTCGYANSTTQSTSCFKDTIGKPRALQILKVLAISLVVPAIISTIAIACFLYISGRRRRIRSIFDNQISVTPPLPLTPQTSGLDASTINSYTKLVIGESLRLPGTNDVICSICLTDYTPKETVKCIPDCQHCFHADCIDEWLKMNGTCPLCRSSPHQVPLMV